MRGVLIQAKDVESCAIYFFQMVELEHTREMVMIGVELCLSPQKKTFGSLIEETGQCKALQMKKPIRSWMLAIWFKMFDFHYLTPPTKKTCHFSCLGKKHYRYIYIYIIFRFHPNETKINTSRKKNAGERIFITGNPSMMSTG